MEEEASTAHRSSQRTLSAFAVRLGSVVVFFGLRHGVRLGLGGAGDGIRPVDPSPEIHEPAAVGAEREAGLVVQLLDLEMLAADRAFAPDHVLVPLVEGLGDSDFVESAL